MKSLTKRFWTDEGGIILSAELVMIGTVGVIAAVVGLNAVSNSVNEELNDISNSIGTLDQSYGYMGMHKWGHAWVVGSSFLDGRDRCDCMNIVPLLPNVKSQDCAVICGHAGGISPAPLPPGGIAPVPHGGIVPPGAHPPHKKIIKKIRIKRKTEKKEHKHKAK